MHFIGTQAEAQARVERMRAGSRVTAAKYRESVAAKVAARERFEALGREAAELLPVLKAVITVGFESDPRLAATYIGDIDAALRLLEVGDA